MPGHASALCITRQCVFRQAGTILDAVILFYFCGAVPDDRGAGAGHDRTRVTNPDGSVASETAAGRTTQVGYDAHGRVASVQGPGATNAVTTSYDDVSAVRGARVA